MRRTKLLGCTAVALLAVGSPASADVVRDGSLGTGTIGAGIDSDGLEATYVINEKHGRFAGQNLFHSFSEFNVGNGEIASFTLTSDCAGCSVSNIIAGVSGGPSDIDGTIKTTSDLTGASLFLLNPAGIFFGAGAQLDVRGSFHASTADLLRFTEGAAFDVYDTSPGRILNTAHPSAFGFTGPDLSAFGPRATSRLTVRDSDLQVEPGATLSLVGADDPDFPALFGTEITASSPRDVILAPDATVQIAAAGRPGVDIDIDLADLEMDSLEPGDLGAVLVAQKARVVVGKVNTDQRAGTVVIRAGEFKLADGARIDAVNSILNSGLEPDLKDALGPIDIATVGNILIDTGSVIETRATGAGASSDVLLTATGNIEIDDPGSQIRTWTSGTGAGGNVVIDAGQSVSVTDGGSIQSFATGSGRAGSIAIDADRIVMDGGRVLSRTTKAGAGGAIDLNARGVEGITLVGGATVVSEARGAGIGGDIDVSAQRLTVSNLANAPNGTFIAANTFSKESSIIEAGDGAGGNLTVDVDTLELLDGGQLIANTTGAANAGAVTVDATSLVHVSGVSGGGAFSGIASNALEDATGAGGRIAITSPIVEVQNGAQIASETIGEGAAGAIDIFASDRVTVESGEDGISRISAASLVQIGGSPQLGPGGTIRIEAGQFEIRNGGQVSASTSGTGDAGNVDIEARKVTISGVDQTGFNESAVFSQSLTFGVEGGGDGGDIAISGSEDVSITDGGMVLAASDGPGLGGSIEITAGRAVRLDGATVSADASGSGDAGNIDIVAGGSLNMFDSAVTTKATSSSGGNIEIAANNQIYLESSAIETEVIAGEIGEAAGDVTARSEIMALNHSHIIANAAGEGVDAGNISITVDHLILSGDSFLQASAETGVDGTINVSSPDADLTGTLATLPDNFLDASALLARDCAARTTRAGSFSVETRGKFPPPPDSTLGLDAVAPGFTPASGEGHCPAVEDLS